MPKKEASRKPKPATKKPATKKKKKPANKAAAPPAAPPPPPPPPAAPAARLRGASRMREQGYRQVILWFDEVEFAMIERAARKAEKKTATWARERAYSAAMMELFPKASLDDDPKQLLQN